MWSIRCLRNTPIEAAAAGSVTMARPGASFGVARIAAFPVVNCVAMLTHSMIEDRSLHDLLLGGLGVELPIRGGYGSCREDPIVITAPDADGIAMARLLTLHALGRGRGIFWHTIGEVLLGDAWPGIEQ
ncbi:MAG: hypothetical protein J2P53_18945, partial [Bradyrhizobiaceae bacterium]|nr:hypothetical protein [Bradyrhizobiaceae bacterium]